MFEDAALKNLECWKKAFKTSQQFFQ